MIRTKITFIIFVIFTIIIFPYYTILCLNSDFLSSLVPGWHTTIIPARLISNLIKFFILLIVSIYYFKLSKISKEIKYKKFVIHLLLTIPAIFIAKLNLYEFVTIYFYDPESFLTPIQMVILINIFINLLFFIGQILFGIYYFRCQKNNNYLVIE